VSNQYPTMPQPPQQPWGPPPPPPLLPPQKPGAGVWIAVAAGVLLVLVGVFAVTAFAAPGFLVDDDSDGDGSSEAEPASKEEGEQGELPDIEIPPPNASPPESGDVPPPSVPDGSDEPEVPDEQDAVPTGDAAGFAEEYLARVAAGDEAGVDESMCSDDQEWQYDTAVSEGRALSLTDPRADASAPGGILADLTGPEGTADGRITVIPDDTGGWCVETFYVF